MKFRPGIRRSLLTALLAAVVCIAAAEAAVPQTPPQGVKGGSVSLERFRGKKSIVRGGRMPLPDSLRRDSLGRDSLRTAVDSTLLRLDSLGGALLPQDSLLLQLTGGDSLLRDTLLLDSLRRDSLALAPADTARTEKKRNWFMSDSMSLSRVCWMSIPIPGYGQIYNKQYWKLPILYGTFGTSLALYFHENKKFKPLKRRFEEITSQEMSRTEELDAVQSEMIHHNTRRQIYLFAAIGSYIYFIGDAAVNYATNDVSSVKKATTLATICPAAGQIYNKSYWKVPIVLGGFASMIYIIDWNTRGYQRFKKAYRLRYDYDQKVAAHNQWKEDVKNDPDLPVDRRIQGPLFGRFSQKPQKQLPTQPRPEHHRHGGSLHPSDRRRARRRASQGFRRLGRPLDAHRTRSRLRLHRRHGRTAGRRVQLLD